MSTGVSAPGGDFLVPPPGALSLLMGISTTWAAGPAALLGGGVTAARCRPFGGAVRAPRGRRRWRSRWRTPRDHSALLHPASLPLNRAARRAATRRPPP